MNVNRTYLYVKIHETSSSKPKERYSMKLKYHYMVLNQSRRMWYNQFSKYLYIKKILCAQFSKECCWSDKYFSNKNK